MSIFNLAIKTIKKNRMFKKRDSVLLGLSGGGDSVFLLHLLKKIEHLFEIKIFVAHINHQLRGRESFEDEEFVFKLSKKFKLPFFLKREKIDEFAKKRKIGLEEAGRIVRYNFFNEICTQKKIDKIAVAHNADDNAELVLMNLLRGTGKKGFSGIAPVRDNIIRPLIEIDKKKILTYLKKNKIKYQTDSSNEDISFIRNKIRKRLIPYIERNYNQNIKKNLNNFASIMRDEEDWIEEIVSKKCKIEKNKETISLSIKSLKKENRAIARRIIRKTLDNFKNTTFEHVESILSLICFKKGFKSLDLPSDLKVEKEKGVLKFFIKKKTEQKKIFEYKIQKSSLQSKKIYIKEDNLYIRFEILYDAKNILDSKTNKNAVYLDFEKLHFPIRIRNIKKGDYFIPLGMNGKQKISKFFINNKISLNKRNKAFVFLSNNKIFWLFQHRISNEFKMTKSTKKILKIEAKHSK